MRSFFTSFIALIFVVLGTNAQAETVPPHELLKTVGSQLFDRIASEQESIKATPGQMQDIVEQELMPHVDYKYAAYKIMGKHLKSASKEQRQKFVDSMRSYLVSTYSKALNQYTNQEVVFQPGKAGKKKIVTVKAKILDPGKPDIRIDFKMRQNKKTLQWKAFDMVVEGISLLETKQAELGAKIRRQGLDQVTHELAMLTL